MSASSAPSASSASGARATRRRIRLGWVLVLSFAALSSIPLVFILAYGYTRNQAAIAETLDEQLARDTARNIHGVAERVDGVVSIASIVGAAVEADPAMFHSDRGDSILWRSVATSPQIDALYVSFEDGHHRVITRIDDDRRKSDPRIPAGATWHASYIDDFTAGAARARHRRFFATFPTVIEGGGYSDPTTIDLRALPHYAAAKARDGVALSDPIINPDTGSPIMSVGWPVHHDGAFIGVVGANLTLSALSAYLREHRFSANSVTVIVDDAGRIIAHPDPAAAVRIAGGKAELSRVADLADRRVSEALAHRAAGGGRFRFTSSTGEELAVATEPFPAAFGKSWTVVIVAPTADFVGTLERTNRNVFALLALALAVELLLVYALSSYIGRHIARVSNAFAAARRLSFAAPAAPSGSFIGEISDLEGGFALLQNALSSFAKFVPADVVARFIESGQPVAPGVEQRDASIFFCDLEGFSGQAENLTPAQLLAQLTQYFAAVTGAIAEEQGTIDKFIGDAVMAFWSAPAADHVLRACRAAVRARRRMETLQQAWRTAGQPAMNVRIGVHSSSVLVGNIGSSERLSYTAIGDGVNVASRLEGINKTFGSTVCVSDAVLAALGGRGIARPLRLVRVKGRRQEFMIYELLAIAGTDDPELAPRANDEELAALSAKAADLRHAGDVPAAKRAYLAILERFPDDRVTRLLLDELPGES